MFKAPVPAKLPHLLTIVDDIGQPVKRLAHFLDISPCTMRRYIAAGQAPRPIMLALYWETQWGQAAAYCDIHRSAQLLGQEAASLRRQVQQLRQQIEHMQSIIDQQCTGAANAPWVPPQAP